MGAMRPAPGSGRDSRGSTPPRSGNLARSPAMGSSSTDAFAWTASPCRALSGLAVLQVSCGSRHTLATVEGGEAYSWGWGACGQLGHGDDHSVGCPRVIEALKTGEGDAALGPVSWVSAGGIHSAAVLEGGRVFTWGGSSYGQLGLGPAVTTQGMQPLPGKVMLSETESPLGSPRVSATGLTRHSSMTQKAAVLAMETAPKTELLAKTVVCGGMHTAALTAEGVVYCWGRADSGQLGIGAAWVHETSSGVMGVEWPRRVRGLLEGRRTESIACGGFHTAAVTTDGECYTWGKEDFGMLGCSNAALLKGGLFQPHRVTLQDMTDVSHAEQGNGSGGGKQKAKAVACGGWHTAVVGEKGGVWMCGRGEYGRLGLGDQKSQWHLTPAPLERGPIPAPVPPSPRSAASAVPASDKPGGAVHGFGGTADSSAAVVPPSPPPVAEIGGGPAVRTTDPARMVALGGSHSLVMTSSGRVFGFGRQDDGRLGVEMNTEEVDSGSMLPLEISDLQLEGWRVQSISAGGVHSAAILARRPE
ncbi:conserved unknown protein [Ectocarpus siliculosus]|uniref:RCC1-like domain-containing protein n=1 Tax=Ectocarpus siliculosus TaxID=2880 RepID=D7FS59_ECTSI|nr:conserved unknown protein [Ectocarpus siliculosus]|eukprot:CBJ31000.1 conserved unknown protein [Ectocarpus siliculosus]